jgi:hypothetical protein
MTRSNGVVVGGRLTPKNLNAELWRANCRMAAWPCRADFCQSDEMEYLKSPLGSSKQLFRGPNLVPVVYNPSAKPFFSPLAPPEHQVVPPEPETETHDAQVTIGEIHTQICTSPYRFFPPPVVV